MSDERQSDRAYRTGYEHGYHRHGSVLGTEDPRAREYVGMPRRLAERLLGIAEYYGSPHAEELQEILDRPPGDFTSLGE